MSQTKKRCVLAIELGDSTRKLCRGFRALVVQELPRNGGQGHLGGINGVDLLPEPRGLYRACSTIGLVKDPLFYAWPHM